MMNTWITWKTIHNFCKYSVRSNVVKILLLIIWNNMSDHFSMMILFKLFKWKFRRMITQFAQIWKPSAKNAKWNWANLSFWSMIAYSRSVNNLLLKKSRYHISFKKRWHKKTKNCKNSTQNYKKFTKSHWIWKLLLKCIGEKS